MFVSGSDCCGSIVMIIQEDQRGGGIFLISHTINQLKLKTLDLLQM